MAIKKTLVLLLCNFLLLTTTAQSLVGAWEAHTTDKNGEKLKNVVIFSAGYQVSTWYHAKTGKFISTNGGAWRIAGDTITETVEFDTQKPERVGTEVSFKITITDSTLGIIGHAIQWKRVDDGVPGKLQGSWLISGRKRDGKIHERPINRPRKTMKILSGTRFQWIAYNTETKEFLGTGGGTYTTTDGIYKENIRFFSRDDAKVGLNLEFDYDLIDGKWHHSGLSSKGDPIYEIWSIRE